MVKTTYNISSVELLTDMGGICLLRDVVYVIVPREIFGDGKAEVFGVVDDLKLLAVDIIICHDLITLVGDA